MRATLVSFGSTGDVLPLMALALGLQASGHQVVTVGDQAGSELAARHGLEFHPLEGNLRELMEPGGSLALAIDAGHFTWKSLKDYDAHDQGRMALIQEVARGSDVVVGMPAAHYHALAAARDVGARPVLGVLQPLAPTRDMTPAGAGMPPLPRGFRRSAGRLVQVAGWMNAKGPLNDARRAMSRSPITDPTVDAFTLCAWSPALVPQPADWPDDQFVVTGRWHMPTLGWTPDPDLAAFLGAGEPPVYVGLGSMEGFTGSQRLMDALLAGLAPRRLILAVGPGVLGDRQLPGHVHPMVGFVPHEWLFPRCAAIVHHCGAGTSHQAVASGVTSIPVPISMDQPFWADRLHRLGVASRPLNPRRPSIELVQNSVAAAQSESMRLRAAQLAKGMALEDGVRAAVARLEELVSRGQVVG